MQTQGKKLYFQSAFKNVQRDRYPPTPSDKTY